MFEVRVDIIDCTGQAVCIAVCPENCYAPELDADKKPVIVDVEACNGCGACVRGCPEEAIVVIDSVTGAEIKD